MGMLSDAMAPRTLMTGGALLGAVATQLFGMAGWVRIFFLSRAIEGLGAAAGVPPLLAHITDVTDGDPRSRARAMSYFELSLLAGLALGGLLGASSGVFSIPAPSPRLLRLSLCAGSSISVRREARPQGGREALAGLRRALGEPSLTPAGAGMALRQCDRRIVAGAGADVSADGEDARQVSFSREYSRIGRSAWAGCCLGIRWCSGRG